MVSLVMREIAMVIKEFMAMVVTMTLIMMSIVLMMKS